MHFAIDLRVMASVLRLAGSATFQMLLPMTSYVGVMRILSSFGRGPLAGYTIGFRILMFAMLSASGLSNAAATLVGQNLGARRADRAEQAVWRACLASAVFLTAVGIAFVTGAPQLIGLFALISLGVFVLRVRHGHDAGVQRRRRHAHSDADQPGRGVKSRRSARRASWCRNRKRRRTRAARGWSSRRSSQHRVGGRRRASPAEPAPTFVTARREEGPRGDTSPAMRSQAR